MGLPLSPLLLGRAGQLFLVLPLTGFVLGLLAGVVCVLRWGLPIASRSVWFCARPKRRKIAPAGPCSGWMRGIVTGDAARSRTMRCAPGLWAPLTGVECGASSVRTAASGARHRMHSVAGSSSAARSGLLRAMRVLVVLAHRMRSVVVCPVGGTASPAGAHPWQGWKFSAGWEAQGIHDVVLVQSDVMVEIAVSVARDRAGRWRHLVRPHRIRTDIDVWQVPCSKRTMLRAERGGALVIV
ncbi:hypothetical protein CP978_00250 [Streptomyces nodosus]|uniref:Uncharacterized protein n=1 Tax=Streptomyces nodosus TaxID=40318 RepID=A0A5P2VUA1_9ACTN|nr:hypothetical protein CP978_00250 [Streptomyces nodosus]